MGIGCACLSKMISNARGVEACSRSTLYSAYGVRVINPFEKPRSREHLANTNTQAPRIPRVASQNLRRYDRLDVLSTTDSNSDLESDFSCCLTSSLGLLPLNRVHSRILATTYFSFKARISPPLVQGSNPAARVLRSGRLSTLR